MWPGQATVVLSEIENWRLFIVSIPCDTVRNLNVTRFFISSITADLWTIGCPSWHHRNPPGIEHGRFCLKDPCPIHRTTAHPDLKSDSIFQFSLVAQVTIGTWYLNTRIQILQSSLYFRMENWLIQQNCPVIAQYLVGSTYVPRPKWSPFTQMRREHASVCTPFTCTPLYKWKLWQSNTKMRTFQCNEIYCSGKTRKTHVHKEHNFQISKTWKFWLIQSLVFLVN